jgi:hypothetical protein
MYGVAGPNDGPGRRRRLLEPGTTGYTISLGGGRGIVRCRRSQPSMVPVDDADGKIPRWEDGIQLSGFVI